MFVFVVVAVAVFVGVFVFVAVAVSVGTVVAVGGMVAVGATSAIVVAVGTAVGTAIGAGEQAIVRVRKTKAIQWSIFIALFFLAPLCRLNPAIGALWGDILRIPISATE